MTCISAAHHALLSSGDVGGCLFLPDPQQARPGVRMMVALWRDETDEQKVWFLANDDGS